MISRLVFVFCIVIPVTSFSKMLSINVDKPYSMGAKTIVSSDSTTFNVRTPFNYDTIKFSNGASLSFCNEGGIWTPEEATFIIGLGIDSSKDILSAGFRYSTDASWQVDTNIRKVVYKEVRFYNNSDTTAYSSKRFPDSLVRPDSIEYGYRRYIWGKFLFAYKSGCTPYMTCGQPRTRCVNGFNNVVYLKTKKNKLKFQVSNIFISWHRPSLLNPNYSPNIVDSIQILWSTDSLGNGIFKDEKTSIRTTQNPSGNSAQHSGRGIINRMTMRDLIQCEAPVVLYNFMGQKTGFISDHQLHRVSEGNSPAGMFFYKIDFPDTYTEWGTVLVR